MVILEIVIEPVLQLFNRVFLLWLFSKSYCIRSIYQPVAMLDPLWAYSHN